MSWLTHNAGLKTVSLALATITWFFVKSVTSDWRIIDGVPLDIRLKSGLTVLQSSATAVNVTVRGAREDLRQIGRQELSAVLDLTGETHTGQMTFKITPRVIRGIRGHFRRVQVAQVDPSEVTVNIDQMIERELPVQTHFTGDLPQGLTIERVTVKPETVRLRGPRALLDSMRTATTLPIDVAGRHTSFRERVELTPLQFPGGASQRNWVEVDVRLAPAQRVDTNSGQGVEQKP
jgi:YbbR domain-containing protein